MGVALVTKRIVSYYVPKMCICHSLHGKRRLTSEVICFINAILFEQP